MLAAFMHDVPRRPTTMAALIVCAVALSGCHGPVPNAPTAESKPAPSATTAPPTSSASDCTAAQAPLQAVESRDPTEPRLFVPEPQGWSRNTSLDSDIIRYVLANPSMTADSFTPTVVVTLEHVPGTDVTPQDVLDQQRSLLEEQAGATDLTVSPATICGLAAETIDYTAAPQGAVPARPAKVLIITAPYGNDTWVATATMQTTNPGNPTYQQDATTILTGFQMLPPPA